MSKKDTLTPGDIAWEAIRTAKTLDAIGLDKLAKTMREVAGALNDALDEVRRLKEQLQTMESWSRREALMDAPTYAGTGMDNG